MGPLEIEDPVFWTEPFRNVDRVQWRLFNAAPPALVLDAPSRVALAERETLPVAGVLSTSASRGAELHGRLLVVAWCEPEGTLRKGAVFDVLPVAPSFGAPDDGSQAILPFDADARDRVGLPWVPSRLTLWAVASEVLSNPVPVTLESDREPIPAPPPRTSFEPSEEVRFAFDADLIPAEAGIVLGVEPRVARGSGASLRGAFAVPALARDAWAEGASLGATHLVSITLLLSGVGLAHGIPVTLRVPARREGERVTGTFALDVLAHAQLVDLRPGPVHVHAFAAGLAAKPVTFEVLPV